MKLKFLFVLAMLPVKLFGNFVTINNPKNKQVLLQNQFVLSGTKGFSDKIEIIIDNQTIGGLGSVTDSGTTWSVALKLMPGTHRITARVSNIVKSRAAAPTDIASILLTLCAVPTDPLTRAIRQKYS